MKKSAISVNIYDMKKKDWNFFKRKQPFSTALRWLKGPCQ
jgi:hypothetical protein